jgi:predicted metal-dependent hydrolase
MPKKAENKQLKYGVDYRNIKYPRLEYKTGNLLLILPKDFDEEISILEKHREWITQKEKTIKQALEAAKKKNINIKRTNEELKQLIYLTTRRFEKETKLKVNKVFFRQMRTKWGSYSSKGNLTLNTLLKYLPQNLIEYVIFHEMVHSQERRHNEAFWNKINKQFRDWQTLETDLLVYWFLVQKKIPA